MTIPGALERQELPPADPIVRFNALLDDAKRVDRAILPEPTAFALGTVGPDGQPSVRILLIKQVDARGFVFYTNSQSRKGRELSATGKAALCFHWQALEQQVRVEGPVSRVTDAEADAYFARRARLSQIGAWASRQSEVIDPPGELERRVAEFEARFAGRDVPRPPHWGGWRVTPVAIEFWKNMDNRLHVRHKYTRDGERWRVETLYP
jgi:pyridoxamine 5'-phosphate oxidase